MMKQVILLSGNAEQRKQNGEVVTRVLVADSNSVYADVISIDDFMRSDLKAAYSDLKKQYKRALHSSRGIIVIDIPADTRNAWQTYVDLALMEPMMNFIFHCVDVDGMPRSINTKKMPCLHYTVNSPAELETILRTVLTGQS